MKLTNRLENIYFNKVKWLLSLFIFVVLIINTGCNNEKENIIEPPVYKNSLVKGLKIVSGENSPTIFYDFEYRNDTIVKIKYNYNTQRYKELEIFYNNYGIDNINVTETSSIVSKYIMNFEYENGRIIKLTSTGNTIGNYITNYYYKNDKLDKIISMNNSINYVTDSVVFSDFDSFSQRPGMYEYYFINPFTFKKNLSYKYKYVYNNGNLIEVYKIESNNPEKFNLNSKYTYNSESSLYDEVMSIYSISISNPYIPNNYNRNNISNADTYDKECNGKLYNDNILNSTLTHNYIKNSNGDVDKIFSYSKNYCGYNLYTKSIELKY